jgi:hypothetical protein
MRSRRLIVMAAMLASSILPGVSCEDRGPTAPSSFETVEQFLQALRQRGLTVTLADQLPPASTPYFSVPAQVVRVNGSSLNVFEYPNPEAAASDASQVTPEGQFPTMMVTWISTPRFYRGDRLIVLYVGCTTDIVQALDATIGRPFVIGSTPCRLVN